MATVSPTRTLADVYRERLQVAEEADPTQDLVSALHKAISRMAPYAHETGDLRPSEAEWLDKTADEALTAAENAAIAAVVSVYQRELPRILPAGPGEMPADGMAPPDLWAQGGDAISQDAELAGEPER